MIVNLLHTKMLKKGRATYVARLFVLLIILGFVSAPVSAADPNVDQRVKRLEQMLDNQNLMQMLNSLQALQREVSQLRGDVEVLSFELGKIKKQQKDIYLDLDQRIQQVDQSITTLQSAPPAVIGFGSVDGAVMNGSAEAADAGAAGDVSETLGEQESYQAALSVLKSGRYEDAIQAYQMFLVNYPDSAFASNAQYWMAEAYYVLKDFQSSIAQFQKVISTYPESRKVSDAYLKIGFSYYELKDWANARATLEKVITDFSTSTAARLAQRRIQKMKLEGNI